MDQSADASAGWLPATAAERDVQWQMLSLYAAPTLGRAVPGASPRSQEAAPRSVRHRVALHTQLAALGTTEADPRSIDAGIIPPEHIPPEAADDPQCEYEVFLTAMRGIIFRCEIRSERPSLLRYLMRRWLGRCSGWRSRIAAGKR